MFRYRERRTKRSIKSTIERCFDFLLVEFVFLLWSIHRSKFSTKSADEDRDFCNNARSHHLDVCCHGNRFSIRTGITVERHLCTKHRRTRREAKHFLSKERFSFRREYSIKKSDLSKSDSLFSCQVITNFDDQGKTVWCNSRKIFVFKSIALVKCHAKKRNSCEAICKKRNRDEGEMRRLLHDKWSHLNTDGQRNLERAICNFPFKLNKTFV